MDGTAATLGINNELLIYDRQRRLALTDNVLAFWYNQNNALTVVAEIVLAIPNNQVSVERIYSSLKYIQADECDKEFAENMEDILLVKTNGKFVYDC